MKFKDIQVGEELHVCPNCGYEDGFHVSFLKAEKKHEIVLICPACHSRFRPGWTVEMAKES